MLENFFDLARCIRGVSVGLDDIRSRIGCSQHLGSELDAHLYEQT